MKKIYISLPMGGHETTVKKRYDNAVIEVKEKYGEDVEIFSPDNIDEFGSDDILKPREHDWAWYMGRDIEILLRCDSIYMTKGYLDSPGCMVELAVAKQRNMDIIYAPNSLEKI